MFSIVAIGKNARRTPTIYGLVDMFKTTGCFMHRTISDGYSYHQVHFRIDGRIEHKDLHGTIIKKKFGGDKSGDLRGQAM